MCVRYTLHKTDAALGAISRALGEPLEVPDWAPRYNITLTDFAPVVARSGAAAAVRLMRWGLVPENERANPRPRLLANARAETVASLPAFRRAAAGRRCLVPANGFYEWLSRGTAKLPYLFTLRGEEPFALAGIWDPASDGLPETYCLLTTAPNEVMAPVHDRMPVILTAETMPRWIGDQPLAPGELLALTRPIDPGLMESRPLGRYVSNSRNQGPACLDGPDAPREGEFNFG